MGGGFGNGLPSVLVDYLAAYALVGTAGFFRRVKGGAIIGTVVGCFLRFAAHFCSGLFIFPYVAFAWDTISFRQVSAKGAEPEIIITKNRVEIFIYF